MCKREREEEKRREGKRYYGGASVADSPCQTNDSFRAGKSLAIPGVPAFVALFRPAAVGVGRARACVAENSSLSQNYIRARSLELQSRSCEPRSGGRSRPRQNFSSHSALFLSLSLSLDESEGGDCAFHDKRDVVRQINNVKARLVTSAHIPRSHSRILIFISRDVLAETDINNTSIWH